MHGCIGVEFNPVNLSCINSGLVNEFRLGLCLCWPGKSSGQGDYLLMIDVINHHFEGAFLHSRLQGSFGDSLLVFSEAQY